MISAENSRQNGQSPAQKLQERLNQPEVADGLNRLLDRIDSVSFAVEAIEGFIARGDTIIESVADTVKDLKKVDSSPLQEFVKQAPSMLQTGTQLANTTKGVNFVELEQSRILERLTDPDNLKQINALLDRLPLIAFMVESLDGFLQRGDIIIENIADMAKDLKQANIDFDLEQLKSLAATLPKLQKAGEQILNSELMGDNVEKVIGAGINMIEAGMLDEEVVKTLGDIGRKGVETYQQVSQNPVPPVGGLWGMMRAARDPDVQKTVSFGVAFAKAFSKHLQ